MRANAAQLALEKARAAIASGKVFQGAERTFVAVSGGVDSMALLHILHRLHGKLAKSRLTIAHFNHQLRGKESDADERLARQTARQLKIPIIVARANIRAEARQRGWSLEMAARRARHDFLARAARRAGCSVIALAHHRDDQVELFFLRLLRGAGGEGLAGMKWRSPSPADKSIFLARPLLDCSKADLHAYAAANNIRFSEDATNASLDILRNRLRHTLLPLLRSEFQPALDDTILRAMDLIGAESEAIAAIAEQWLANRATPFLALAVAVQRRALQTQMFQLGLTPDFDLIERLRLQPETPFTVAPGQQVVRDDCGLLREEKRGAAPFQSEQKKLSLRGNSGSTRFAGLTLAWEFAERRGADFSVALNTEQFDADKVGSIITLRHWRPGDRFQPIGAKAPAKLQDLFTNARAPAAERRGRVVAATAAGEIFWVEGLRLGEACKLRPQTRRRLLWRWRRKPL